MKFSSFTALTLGAMTLGLTTGSALAEMPVFTATCTEDLVVDGDSTGAVYINDEEAEVTQKDETHYQAKLGKDTINITFDEGGGNPVVTFAAKDGTKGKCELVEDGGQDTLDDTETPPEAE